MISSYPDYFAAIPMMPRGIPVIPGYPSMGEISSPITDTYDPEGDVPEEDDSEFEDDENEEQTSGEYENEDEDEGKEDADNIDIDPDWLRQVQPGTTGTAGTTGTTGPTGATGGCGFEMAPGSPVIQDTDYIQGYLRTQIGKRVRVTFLLGTGTMQDRTGILETVGISYIILRDEGSNAREMADLYSIKFVTIFDS
ncbi:MAG: hypothetical protein LKE46_12390 [Clostridium sp.]|jgi:hypothetical protein|uniref:hypothetical protein n=1 Tax=Clostridium sp. TaxID=1506 RepID=UPI0025BF5D26|nr:hypothetical protein [Clostridium sp.]MCH3965059.1 hypothetical protein [Clostridium sp.]MCI1714280.1 hypothetical protein [Clostridium sp.]MCI1798542.1 hypothetical protein [Clostridium sp.]MCI1812727.1 hypothetical protein [Clostridium sp.]MCI1869351.1 hypothetical protein [Clostridium sp.]